MGKAVFIRYTCTRPPLVSRHFLPRLKQEFFFLSAGVGVDGEGRAGGVSMCGGNFSLLQNIPLFFVFFRGGTTIRNPLTALGNGRAKEWE